MSALAVIGKALLTDARVSSVTIAFRDLVGGAHFHAGGPALGGRV